MKQLIVVLGLIVTLSGCALDAEKEDMAREARAQAAALAKKQHQAELKAQKEAEMHRLTELFKTDLGNVGHFFPENMKSGKACKPDPQTLSTFRDNSYLHTVNGGFVRVDQFNVDGIRQRQAKVYRAIRDELIKCISEYDVSAGITNRYKGVNRNAPGVKLLITSAIEDLNNRADQYKNQKLTHIENRYRRIEESITLGLNITKERIALANTRNGFNTFRTEFLSTLDKYDIEKYVQEDCTYRLSALNYYLNRDYIIDVDTAKLNRSINAESDRANRCTDRIIRHPDKLLASVFPNGMKKAPAADKRIAKRIVRFRKDVAAAKNSYAASNEQIKRDAVAQINTLISAGKIEKARLAQQRQFEQQMAQQRQFEQQMAQLEREQQAENQRLQDQIQAAKRAEKKRIAQIRANERADAQEETWKIISDGLDRMKNSVNGANSNSTGGYNSGGSGFPSIAETQAQTLRVIGDFHQKQNRRKIEHKAKQERLRRQYADAQRLHNEKQQRAALDAQARALNARNEQARQRQARINADIAARNKRNADSLARQKANQQKQHDKKQQILRAQRDRQANALAKRQTQSSSTGNATNESGTTSNSTVFEFKNQSGWEIGYQSDTRVFGNLRVYLKVKRALLGDSSPERIFVAVMKNTGSTKLCVSSIVTKKYPSNTFFGEDIKPGKTRSNTDNYGNKNDGSMYVMVRTKEC